MSRVRPLPSFRLLTIAILTFALTAPLSAQGSSSGDLASIEKALLRIADVLDRQTQQTHATLLLSRLEIENRDLRSLDDTVASNRSSLRSVQLEERHFVQTIERLRDHMNDDTTSQEERLQLQRQLAIDEDNLEILQSNRADLEQRVIELENEAHDAALRRAALRAEIDEILGVDPR